MQERYYIHKAKLDDLMCNDLDELLQKKRASGEKVCIVMQLTNLFDEWKIEKYIESFKRLQPDRIQITLSTDFYSKPTAHQIDEVQDALEHFAHFERYDEEIKCQFFSAGPMEILFWNVLE